MGGLSRNGFAGGLYQYSSLDVRRSFLFHSFGFLLWFFFSLFCSVWSVWSKLLFIPYYSAAYLFTRPLERK